MVPCKAADLDPVAALVAPLVFAVGSEVDVSGHLGVEPEGSLVFCVQDFLGESWPLYLLLWAPGSPCHLKCHVMGHEGVFHPCEAKTKSLRRVPTVPCSPRTSECLLPLFSLPAPWALSTNPVQEQLLLCSSTCHDNTHVWNYGWTLVQAGQHHSASDAVRDKRGKGMSLRPGQKNRFVSHASIV